MKSSLERLNQASPMNDEELFARKRRAWLEEGTIVFTWAQVQSLGLMEQMTLESIAQRIYGKRRVAK